MTEDLYEQALVILAEMGDEAVAETMGMPEIKAETGAAVALLAGILMGRRDAFTAAYNRLAALRQPSEPLDLGAALIRDHDRHSADCGHVPPGSRCHHCQPD